MGNVHGSFIKINSPKALVDEIAGSIIIKDYNKWSKAVYYNTGVEFGDVRGDVTSKILFDSESENHNFRKNERRYGCWTLTLSKHLNKVTGKFVVELHILGNPSQTFYGGKNYRNIPFDEFKNILIHFSKVFCLNLEDIKPAGSTEASITIELEPDQFVLNESSLRGRVFSGKADKYGDDRYEETRNSSKDFMGYKFEHGHMTNKIYLPGVKFGEYMNAARVEVRFDKIQSLLDRCTLESWDDLLKLEGHYKCYEIVLESWDNTIVTDPTLRQSKKYPDWLNDMIYKGKKAGYWMNEFPKTASDKTLKKRLMEYRELSFKKGDGLHTRVRLMIEEEGEKLRNPSTRLSGRIQDIENIKTNIEECINNTIMNNNKKKTQIQKITRKQIEKYKRELKEEEKQRFMVALKETLDKLAA